MNDFIKYMLLILIVAFVILSVIEEIREKGLALTILENAIGAIILSIVVIFEG